MDELKGDHLHPFCLSMLQNSKPIRSGQIVEQSQACFEVGIGCSSGTILIYEIKPNTDKKLGVEVSIV